MAHNLIIGNTAEAVGKRYSWIFYVRGATHLVEKVRIELHPTFKNPVRESRGPVFEFKSSGWGTFDIDVTIKFHSGIEVPVVWPLQFDSPDSNTVFEIPAGAISSSSNMANPEIAESAVDSDGSSYDGVSADPAELQSAVGLSAIAELSPTGDDFVVFRLNEDEVSPRVNMTNPTHAEAMPPMSSSSEHTSTSDRSVPKAKAKGKARTRAGTPPAYGSARRSVAKAKAATSSASEDAVVVQAKAKAVAKPRPASPREMVGLPIDESVREALCSQLVSEGFLHHSHPNFMHGRAFQGPFVEAKCLWASKKKPRDDHSAPAWLTASEFEDPREVMRAKCKQLALLLRMSRKTVAYTGAGISAAVIGMAARSGTYKTGWEGNTRTAKPTFTHHALGFLGQNGIIHSWVQQNHDGLPQKAGFPQESINEIHGSWYDPCNPVVKYSGSLHDRAYPWMEDDANTADLVLVLGTSLGGLNADQVCTKTADRSLLSGPRGALGSVIMNLQQTEQDGKMTLRFFGKSDDILMMLLQELGFGRLKTDTQIWPRESRVLVPYDHEGKVLKGDAIRRMWWDLRDGQRVRLASDHNIQGARQPQYMHIGASRPVTHKGITREPGIGLGSVVRRDEASSSFLLNIEGVQMRLGIWWLESARRGALDRLPLVNEKPSFE